MYVLKLTREGKDYFLKCDKYGTFESMRLVELPWDATVIELPNTCWEFKERAEGFFRATGKVMHTREIALMPPVKIAEA